MEAYYRKNEEFMYDSGEFLALAFTIKKLSNHPSEIPTRGDYISILDRWSSLDNNTVHVYKPYFEEDSHGKLHIHGVVVVRKNFYKKRLATFGYSTYTTDIYHLKGWLDYIKKAQTTIDL